MNAKKIKDILISYIKATTGEVRIYQEKNIGSSICDVMAVTDRLIGYEIKSDLDNYARLQAQVKAYTTFFDENYLVVGERHIHSAAEKIPDCWGILCVTENDVALVRKATTNNAVSRRAQLSILWKLELKNLLVKNRMPAYAQKEKGYIADHIANSMDSNLLGKQIANELLHRDYSVFGAKDYTEYSAEEEKAIQDFPAAEIVDMLSERNLSEFTLDQWIRLYKRATAVKEQKELSFKTPIPNRTPHAIPYTDIEVSLGVPWVSTEIIDEFVRHILCADRTYSYVEYESITGSWYIRNKKYWGEGNRFAEGKYGLKRYNALYIIEATLNLREIKLFDDGSVYNEADTLAALEKQKCIQQEFKRWIWEDEDRRWLVEEAYNKMFAAYKPIVSDGSRLTFPDMAKGYTLYPYQKDAVQRILKNKNTLLAFDVGAGKTYIMIAAAMKLRQEGISRKNLFVVPNHIVGQWEKIFEDLYPKATILAIEPKSFKRQMRQKVLQQIQSADYDGIIMAYSCFEMIPLSADSIWQNMHAKLKQIETALLELKTPQEYYICGHNHAALEAEKKRLEKRTREFLEIMTPQQAQEITFDELEIDSLFLDEAHNYKNLPIKTHLRNLRGINTTGSGKCQDLLHKVRVVQQNGRGVVFATGTPLCNSLSDTYAMQVYLQYDELQRNRLDVFDNWVKTFALPEQLCEIDVDASKYRFVKRFSKFFNLPELSAMFSQIAVFYANNSANDLPKLQGYTDVTIKKNPALSSYMKELVKRTENIRSGMIDRKYDNMLKVSTDGRKAALDLSLVGRTQNYDAYSKVYRCVDNVTALYNQQPDTTQLIFCDYSTPKAEQFNVYAELKRRLIEKGIPEKEIAFIHSYQTESRKVELFRKFNAGEMRILIGSTFKLGIGANVQRKLKAIHHLDVPWRPADMVQREGRIIRRGNENETVQIYRYITEGSFDSYSWQVLETKQRFISQFLSGSTYQRTASDLDSDVLTYAEVKALALSQPLMKQLAQKENELKTFKILETQAEETRKRLIEECNQLRSKTEQYQTHLGVAEKHRDDLMKKTNEQFLQAMRSIKDLFTPDVIFGNEMLSIPVSIFDFTIALPAPQDSQKPYLYLEKDTNRYVVLLSDSASGNAKRIIGKLKRFDKVVEKIRKEMETIKQNLHNNQQLLKQKNTSYQKQIVELSDEIEVIKKKINVHYGEDYSVCFDDT
ncbi:MAG: sce7726 family protein [Clostridia bacterium]|nr:sce7726 family protein [Clostridia bacterium]